MTRNSAFLTAAILTFGLGQYSPAQEPAPEQSTPWTCDQVSDGKTAQQRFDAVLADVAGDKRLTALQRASVRAAQADFDGLCAVDAEVGSREASIFAVQAGQRMKRIGEAAAAAAAAAK
jgi:hypothetical protein